VCIATSVSSTLDDSTPEPPPKLCEFINISDDNNLRGRIYSIVKQYAGSFDRFIIIYQETSFSSATFSLVKELTSGLDLAMTEPVLPVFYPRLLKHPEEKDVFFRSFKLIELSYQMVQLLVLSLDQAYRFFELYDIDLPSTCLVFVDLDRICYHSPRLLDFHFNLLSKLSIWCGYIFISQHPGSISFYYWLASRIDKNLISDPIIHQYSSNVSKWEFLTLTGSPYDLRKEVELTPKFEKKIREVWKAVPYSGSLFTDVSLDAKSYAIQDLSQEKRGKDTWLKIRKLSLGLIITHMISLKQKLLIITNHFDHESWEEFCKDNEEFICPLNLVPVFLSPERLQELKSLIKNNDFDRILLDLGDELTPWLSVPFLDNLLAKTSFIGRIIPEIPVTFFRPILTREESIRWLLSTPPVPTHLSRIESIKKRMDELLFINCLLNALQRTTKNDFYSKFKTSWITRLIRPEDVLLLSNRVRLLRQAGIFDRLHFTTTPLSSF